MQSVYLITISIFLDMLWKNILRWQSAHSVVVPSDGSCWLSWNRSFVAPQYNVASRQHSCRTLLCVSRRVCCPWFCPPPRLPSVLCFVLGYSPRIAIHLNFQSATLMARSLLWLDGEFESFGCVDTRSQSILLHSCPKWSLFYRIIFVSVGWDIFKREMHADMQEYKVHHRRITVQLKCKEHSHE